MLSYDFYNNIYGIDFEAREKAKDQYVLDELTKRREKLKAKEESIENLQYERNLVLNDILTVIREDLNQSGYNMFRYLNEGDLFWEAWRYGNHHKDKDFEPYQDKEVKKKEKQSFEFVTHQIEHMLLKDNPDFKFDNEVIDSDFSLYYEFTYKYKNQKIYVCIPNFKCATDRNYLSLLNGYVIRYRESEYCTGWITSDLDYHNIYEKLMAWINEHWPEEKVELHEIDEETAKQLQDELMKNAKPTGVKID